LAKDFCAYRRKIYSKNIRLNTLEIIRREISLSSFSIKLIYFSLNTFSLPFFGRALKMSIIVLISFLLNPALPRKGGVNKR